MRHSIHSVFYDQAAAHEAADRYDEALALYYQVHRWAPEDPDLWWRLGVLSFLLTDRAWLRQHGKEDGHLGDMGAVNAELYLARAIALAPQDARLYFWQGWVRHALYQKPEQALASLETALQLEARHPYAHAAIARIALAADDLEQAIAHQRRAVALLPESARFHYDMGACLTRAGDAEAARQAFETAMRCQRLPLGEGAPERYLVREFHGDGVTMRALIQRWYAEVMAAS